MANPSLWIESATSEQVAMVRDALTQGLSILRRDRPDIDTVSSATVRPDAKLVAFAAPPAFGRPRFEFVCLERRRALEMDEFPEAPADARSWLVFSSEAIDPFIGSAPR